MKWFKVQLHKHGINRNKTSIKSLVIEEFDISVNEIIGEGELYDYAVVSNNNSVPTCFKSDELLIIGDISVHNKEELLSNNNLKKSTYKGISDEVLFSLLYKEKGIRFIHDVVGEFSFVLYDVIKMESYFVRDQIGVKTLFWSRNDLGLVIASDIFLLQEETTSNNINNSYFQEFHIRNGIIDIDLTPFVNINRVPSGCYAHNRDYKTKIYEYWNLVDIKETLNYKDERLYLEEFREILLNSVKSRLVKDRKNSVMLSGGMDSTSIYALSKLVERSDGRYVTKSVSAIFDELQECDESSYILGLLEKYNDTGIYINSDNVLLFDEFPNRVPFSYEPNVNALSFNFTYSAVKKAAEEGLFNVLTGYGGDQLLTGSMYVTRDLLKEFKVKEALCYITDYSITTNSSALENISRYTLFPNILKNYEIKEKSGYYKNINKKLKGIKHYHQKDLYYQINSTKSHIYTDRLIGGLASVDISHPFLDRRLIEYVFKIPGKLRRSREQGKYILRESMNEFLTNEITGRINKTAHVAHTYKSIRQNWGEIQSTLYDPIAICSLGLIDVNDWRNELLKWRNGVQVNDSFWTLLSIELWFNGYRRKSGL